MPLSLKDYEIKSIKKVNQSLGSLDLVMKIFTDMVCFPNAWRLPKASLFLQVGDILGIAAVSIHFLLHNDIAIILIETFLGISFFFRWEYTYIYTPMQLLIISDLSFHHPIVRSYYNRFIVP